MASISIRNLKKTYGNVEVMHSVSVDIAEGEFVVFVGPSEPPSCISSKCGSPGDRHKEFAVGIDPGSMRT